jgi:hypothetical protein
VFDGDTVIYNEREEIPNEKYTIKESVTPKQGRMVIFFIRDFLSLIVYDSITIKHKRSKELP